MAYSFLQLSKEVLEEIKQPLTAGGIWKKGQELGLSKKINSEGKTPWDTISANIYMDMKNKGEDSDFIKVKSGVFGLRTLASLYQTEYDADDTDVAENAETKRDEGDLHPLLTAFVKSNRHFKCYTKTISHEKSSSSKKGLNEWLHPDLVGVYFPFDEEDFKKETLTLSKVLKENLFKIFSFEMKIEVTLSDLKKYYFQAVSNSSWAHEGYLVALELAVDDSELLNEIRRLNNSFGIGVILLNPQNIEQSEILFSAKTKDKLDWDTVNKLVEANPDFKDFLRDLGKDCELSEVRNKNNYDECFAPEELSQHIKDKGIL